MTTDPAALAARLRECARMLDYGAKDAANCRAAAGAIDSLTTQVAELTRERDHYKDRVMTIHLAMDTMQAERDRLKAALREILGHLEIAAVCPEAIGRPMVFKFDGPELNAIRTALQLEPTHGG